jgi:hypothetical protein
MVYFSVQDHVNSWKDVRKAQVLGFAVSLDFLQALEEVSENRGGWTE